MALTGTFLADFSSFYDAVQRAEVSLKSFESGSSKVEASLNRMTDSFSGRKIISEATIMVEAVNRIGGVSNLTEKELARVGLTANEAADKMRRMGLDVPPGLQKIADATKGIGTAADSSTSVLSGMASMLTRMFTIGAVVAFGREVLAAGDNIQKMADQTGLGTEEVQKLQYIAGQSGTSIESLVGAVQNLQQRLGDDDAGAAGAMKRLGINADAFNRLDTYSQMTTLADAVRSIQDPTEQASVAAALFGKTWKEILPAIKAGMVEVGNQAPIMADETVKSLDRVGDALTRSKQQAISWGGFLVTAIEGAGFAFGDFLSRFNPDNFGTASSEVIKLQKLFDDPTGLKHAIESVKPPVMAVSEELKAFSLSAADATRIGKELTESARESIEVHKKEDAALKAKTESMERLTKAQLDHIHSIGDKLFGSDDIKRATDYAEAIGNLENVSNLNSAAQEEVARVMTAGIEAMVAAGRSTDDLTSTFEALRLKSTETSRDAVEAFQRIQAEAALAAAMMRQVMGLTIIGQTPGSPVTSGGAGSLNQTGNAFFTGMAAGGPVRAGQPYMVGERGPELFVPSSNGSISPNGAGGSVTNHIYVNGTAEDVARKVMAEITRTMRGGRKWPAV